MLTLPRSHNGNDKYLFLLNLKYQLNRPSNKEKDLQRRRKRVTSAPKYRPGFEATSTSCLCFVHFEESCFNVYLSVSVKLKRRQIKDAVPTIDVAEIMEPVEDELTDRKRRQVSVILTGVQL